MPYLTTKNQQIKTGVMYPRGVYSRIVSCSHYDPVPPAQSFAYTETLAQKLWLLGVDVWLSTNPPFPTHSYTFSLWRLTTIPASLAAMYNNENILPVRAVNGTWYWHAYGPDAHFHWSMNKLYEGQGQRFGCVMTGAGGIIAQIHASFEISEG